MIIHDLTPVLTFRYREDVKTSFFQEVVEVAKDNYWEKTLKIVTCNIDNNLAEAEESDTIGLGRTCCFFKIKLIPPHPKHVHDYRYNLHSYKHLTGWPQLRGKHLLQR